MLDTKEMQDRLEKGGFSESQTDALIKVIQMLAEVFVTKEFLRAEMETLRREMKGMEIRIIGIVLGGVALMLALFAFVSGLI